MSGAGERRAVLVVGAGESTGSAIAKRFAREGLVAVCTRRNAEKLEPLVQEIEAEGGQAIALGCDARDEDAVVSLFERIERDVAPLEVVVFNPGANVNFRDSYDDLGCNVFTLSSYHSGNAASVSTQYWDEFVITGAPIGQSVPVQPLAAPVMLP